MKENDIQVKIEIKDFFKMKKKLMDIGAIFLGGWREKTIRFDTKDKTFEKEKLYSSKNRN